MPASDAVDVKLFNLPKGVRIDGTSLAEWGSMRNRMLISQPTPQFNGAHPATGEVRYHGIDTTQVVELRLKAK